MFYIMLAKYYIFPAHILATSADDTKCLTVLIRVS